MWLRLKIIYLIISPSPSHHPSNLTITYYTCPDANFCNWSMNFEDLFSNFDARFIDRFHSRFLFACSLMKKIINQPLFREKSASSRRYVFGVSFNLIREWWTCYLYQIIDLLNRDIAKCTCMCATRKRSYVLCIQVAMN